VSTVAFGQRVGPDLDNDSFGIGKVTHIFYRIQFLLISN